MRDEFCQWNEAGRCRICGKKRGRSALKRCSGYAAYARRDERKKKIPNRLARSSKKRRRGYAAHLLRLRKAELPPLKVRATNFWHALVRFAKSGFKRRTPWEIKRLHSICESCPTGKYVAEVGACKACGCPLSAKSKWRNKLAWRSESCPDGHW